MMQLMIWMLAVGSMKRQKSVKIDNSKTVRDLRTTFAEKYNQNAYFEMFSSKLKAESDWLDVNSPDVRALKTNPAPRKIVETYTRQRQLLDDNVP